MNVSTKIKLYKKLFVEMINLSLTTLFKHLVTLISG